MSYLTACLCFAARLYTSEEVRHPRVKGSFLDTHSLGQSSIASYLPNLSPGLFLAAKSLIRALFDLGYSY